MTEMYLRIYNGSKYLDESEVIHTAFYNVDNFKVINPYTDPELVKEIESQGLVDDYHEYLILDLEDGEQSTFRNSRVNLFKVA